MKRFQLIALFALLVLTAAIHSCKKDEQAAVAIPPEQAHFVNKTSGNYAIANAGDVYKIPIGITNVSSSQRTVTVSITSPTGAVEGTNYTVNKKTFTFEPNQVTDTIVVTGNIAQYSSGRKDSLIFTIVQPGVATSDYNSTFILTMRGPCFEATEDVNLNDLMGNYDNTVETFGTGAPYGPYQTKITEVGTTGPTTGYIKVFNLWDAGPGSEWKAVRFELDWTNKSAKVITLVEQNTGIGDAGTLSSTYAGRQVAVRPFAGRDGSFEICTQKLTLRMQLGVAGLGWFSGLYTVNMGR